MSTSLTTSASPRRTGRRPRADGSSGPAISRELIIEAAIHLARTESLGALSMVRLAKDIGVAPALIHYYMKSRDDLLSAVLNRSFKERVEALPPLTGSWREDLEGLARSMVASSAQWPGLAAYVGSNNRFRLFQRVEPGETDYGLVFFDHAARVFKDGGFSANQAALGYHLLMMFVTSITQENENRQTPNEHQDFIVGHVSKFDPKDVPGASFIVKPFATLKNASTFEAGLTLILDGFARWPAEA